MEDSAARAGLNTAAPLNDHARPNDKAIEKPGSRHELGQGATRNNLVISRFANGQQTASRDRRIVLEQHRLREAPPHMPLRNSDKHVARVLTILPREPVLRIFDMRSTFPMSCCIWERH